jgi:hypothetical protein
MFQNSNSGSELESHGVASQDVVDNAPALLREDQDAEPSYRQLGQYLRYASADVTIGLLVRVTEAHCGLLQRISDGTCRPKAPAGVLVQHS